MTSRSGCCERYSSGSASLARSEGSSKSRYKAWGLSCSSKERGRVVLPAWRGPSSATAGKCCSKCSSLALAALGIILVIMPRHRIIATLLLRSAGVRARASGREGKIGATGRDQSKFVGDRTHGTNVELRRLELLPLAALHFAAAGEHERAVQVLALARLCGLAVIGHAGFARSENEFVGRRIADSASHGNSILHHGDRNAE